MNVIEFLLWPFLSGLFLFAFTKNHRAAQTANIVFNLVWAALCVRLVIQYQGVTDTQSFPVYWSWSWLPELKSRLSLGVDGLNLPLVVLNVFLSVVLAFYSFGKKEISASYLGLFSILNGASVGSLLAADIFAFYIFWEFMLIPMYFLIGKWGGKNRIYAAMKFFAFTMTGSLFLLAAILALSWNAKVASLGWHDITAVHFNFDGWHSMQGLLYLGFLAAFVVKIPVWPFHTWLPDAHTEAPTGGSVILAGVLLKLGVYGIARWCLPLFPEAAAASAPLMMALAVVGIVLGAFAAWQQTDIKRLIAYSSVSHMGFVVLGLFALRPESIQGAMFQNLAHGLSTGALFLLFGIIYERTHTRELSEYGGLAVKSGVVASFFVFATMASVGLPGLPGFVGEYLILSGTFMTNHAIAVVASLGILFGAVYMLNLVKKSIFGSETHLCAGHPVFLKWNEWVAVVPFILAMIYLGLQPQGILQVAERSIVALFVR